LSIFIHLFIEFSHYEKQENIISAIFTDGKEKWPNYKKAKYIYLPGENHS